MISSLLPAARVLVTRQSSLSFSRVAARSFSTSHTASKDFVQELYLKELKSYKPAPTPKDAHVGQVKQLHTPSAPPRPDVPTSASIASDLEAYSQDAPVVSQSGPATEEGPVTSGAEDFLEEVKKPVHDDHEH